MIGSAGRVPAAPCPIEDRFPVGQRRIECPKVIGRQTLTKPPAHNSARYLEGHFSQPVTSSPLPYSCAPYSSCNSTSSSSIASGRPSPDFSSRRPISMSERSDANASTRIKTSRPISSCASSGSAETLVIASSMVLFSMWESYHAFCWPSTRCIGVMHRRMFVHLLRTRVCRTAACYPGDANPYGQYPRNPTQLLAVAT